MLRNKKKVVNITLLLVLLIMMIIPIFQITSFNSSFISTNIIFMEPRLQDGYLQELDPFIIDDSGAGNYTWLEASEEIWCTGQGTFNDPYVIQSINISGSFTQSCLKIRNSMAYFIIKTSYFYEAFGGIEAGGISLQNVSNGNILDNTFITCRSGIFLNQSEHIQINNNSIPYAINAGFVMMSCNDIMISQCSISGTGIYGINTVSCQNLVIAKNELENCGNTALIIDGTDNNVEDNLIKNSGGLGLLISGHGNEVINNDIDHNGWGSGGVGGIMIYQYSNSNIISRNLIKNNKAYGISALSCTDSNLIYDNFFINNVEHADDSGLDVNNKWNNSIIGNYWDDYVGEDSDDDGIGDTPYDVESGIQDLLPIYGDPFHNGEAILIDGSQPYGPTSWQWISTRYWCYGLGTENDPYVIENLVIDGESTEICFEVRDSSDYFILQYCSLYNSTIIGLQDPGLKLDTVNNAQVISNSLYSNKNAIYLNNCNNSRILSNIITNNSKYGIYLLNSFYNNIVSNIVNNNSHGIRFHASTNNIAQDNLIYFNSIGFSFQYGDDNNLSDNSVFNNTSDGFYIFNSDRNIIKQNQIQYNGQYGVHCYGSSDNNVIYLNIFKFNNLNAFDESAVNHWDNTTIGNYWNDYSGADLNDDGIGESPYPIPGIAASQDNYPIWDDGDDIGPLILIKHPLEDEFFGVEAPLYNIEVFDLDLDSIWYTIDGGLTNFTFDVNGTINQLTWMAHLDGLITIVFFANDTFGNVNFAEVSINKDATSPIVVFLPPEGKEFAVGSYTNQFIEWKATDLNPSTYTIELQGSGIIVGPLSWSNMEAIRYNLPDNLSVGIYVYVINFTDVYGNYVSDTVTITIKAVANPQIPFGNWYLMYLIISIAVLVIIQKRKK